MIGAIPRSAPDPLPWLISAQQSDGGWSYHGGGSWTEPTIFALLALSVRHMLSGSFNCGTRWLASVEREDGGWAPQPSVEESTWVTALVASLPTGAGIEAARATGAVEWLLEKTGEESTLLARVRHRLLGVRWEVGERTTGWSWFPGTAAWVTPTALTILALEKWHRRSGDRRCQERVRKGREFLLARTCPDGGWNHGAARALGVDASSYPETTGVALLALHGERSPRIDRAIAAAEKHLARCRSVQGRCWLSLGLLAHGRNPSTNDAPALPWRGAMDAAMSILVESAGRGNNVFLGD